MKRQAIMAMQLALVTTILLSINGCFKDNCAKTYTLYKPVYKTLTQVRADMKSSVARDIEQPGKIYIYGNYIFLNEQQKGIHIINNSQPSSPQNIGFIDIPGNVDMAVNGNTLYADSHGDLVAFDISNPSQVTAKKFVDNVFPHRSAYYLRSGAIFNPDSINIIAGWTQKDTTVDCETYNVYYEKYYSLAMADMSGNFAAPKSGGIGGSMASFTLLNDYLYTVSTSELKTFDVSAPQDPVFKSSMMPGNWSIETIYPFKEKLFLGTRNGMYIFDAGNGGNPTLLSSFMHTRSCDPVIADDDYAYITLRSGTQCEGFSNQLEIVNIKNLTSPSLIKKYDFKNPHGLSKDGKLLFICDGADGLKIYDATDVFDIKLKKHITGMETFDVIAWNKIALVIAKDGLYQFDYTNESDIRLISTIRLKKD